MISAITATGLRKSFGGKIVLDGIDLEVGAGTTFSLLGPNGAGKTTTVQIMSTLVHADGGEVRVAGRDVARDLAAVRATIRTDTVVEVRPSNEADESDVKAAKQVRVDYAGGMLRVTGPKPGAFDFSRKTRSVDVSIELPSDSQVSLDTLAGDVRCAGRLGECRFRNSAGNFWLEQTGPLRRKTGFGHVTADGIAGSAEISTGSGKVQIGEVARGSVVLGTATGDLEIGTAARLEVNTGHGHVHNLLENATRPEEAHQTVEVRGHTSYGDITIRRSRLASGTGEDGQP